MTRFRLYTSDYKTARSLPAKSRKCWNPGTGLRQLNPPALNLIFLCTIILFHQISSLIITPSSIYNHFLQLWYSPFNHPSCGLDNLIRFYCRTPCRFYIKFNAVGGTFWGKCHLGRKLKKQTTFFFFAEGTASLGNAQDCTRIKLIHHLHTDTTALKKGTSQEISSPSMKKLKNV